MDPLIHQYDNMSAKQKKKTGRRRSTKNDQKIRKKIYTKLSISITYNIRAIDSLLTNNRHRQRLCLESHQIVNINTEYNTTLSKSNQQHTSIHNTHAIKKKEER